MSNCALDHKQVLLVGETANKRSDFFHGYFMYIIYARNAQFVCSFWFIQAVFILLFKNFQIDEVKNIGNLPCLEKLVLSSNPLSIIPDYRTKVLAQFGDRASEVSHSALLPLKLAFETNLFLKPGERSSVTEFLVCVGQDL